MIKPPSREERAAGAETPGLSRPPDCWEGGGDAVFIDLRLFGSSPGSGAVERPRSLYRVYRVRVPDHSVTL